MGFSREDFIEIGSRAGAPAIIDGGHKILGVWEEDMEALAPMGFGEQKHQELSAKVDVVEESYRKFGGSEHSIAQEGMGVRAVQKESKRWIRVLQVASMNAFDGSDTVDSFTSEPTPGTSVKRLVRAMTTYTGLAERHAGELAPFGAGPDFAARGKDLLDNLTTSREKQGKAMSNMPEEAADMQFAKGEVYVLCKQLARVARILLPPEQSKFYSVTRNFKRPRYRRKEIEATS